MPYLLLVKKELMHTAKIFENVKVSLAGSFVLLLKGDTPALILDSCSKEAVLVVGHEGLGTVAKVAVAMNLPVHLLVRGRAVILVAKIKPSIHGWNIAWDWNTEAEDDGSAGLNMSSRECVSERNESNGGKDKFHGVRKATMKVGWVSASSQRCWKSGVDVSGSGGGGGGGDDGGGGGGGKVMSWRKSQGKINFDDVCSLSTSKQVIYAISTLLHGAGTLKKSTHGKLGWFKQNGVYQWGLKIRCNSTPMRSLRNTLWLHARSS